MKFTQQLCLNFTFCIVFLGEFLVLVPSHLPHLRLLRLEHCNRLCDKYVEELLAAVPELKVIKS